MNIPIQDIEHLVADAEESIVLAKDVVEHVTNIFNWLKTGGGLFAAPDGTPEPCCKSADPVAALKAKCATYKAGGMQAGKISDWLSLILQVLQIVLGKLNLQPEPTPA